MFDVWYGDIELTTLAVVLLIYILRINPKYMKRPFGKKQLTNELLQ